MRAEPCLDPGFEPAGEPGCEPERDPGLDPTGEPVFDPFRELLGFILVTELPAIPDRDAPRRGNNFICGQHLNINIGVLV